MKRPTLPRRAWAPLGAAGVLLALFAWVAVRTGPLAPVPVTIATVTTQSIQPALYGLGTVAARYSYRIGPTAPGRLLQLDVHVGDRVAAGQVLGAMDPVDLQARTRAQQAALDSATAELRRAQANQALARSQAARYQKLLDAHVVSAELAQTKRTDLALAEAALLAAHGGVAHARAELDALHAQRDQLQLRAPVDGLVTVRDADPGTTLVAGQRALELIDPHSLWIDARFDQSSAAGLAAGLPVRVTLRSRPGQTLPGHVLRVEPQADAVTEELRARIVFDAPPSPLPPLGELAEASVQLPPLPAAPTIPDAALREVHGQHGVWTLSHGELAFVPVVAGRGDLDGRVQILRGLAAGQHIVVYSAAPLGRHRRVRVQPELTQASP